MHSSTESMPTLEKHELVSVQKFVATYPDGEVDYNEYMRALDLARQGLKLHEIAKKLNRHRDTVNTWLRAEGEKKPVCVKGLNSLGNLVPLTLSHSEFKGVNLLYAAVFAGGNIHAHYTPHVFAEEEKLRALGEEISKHLDVSPEVHTSERTWRVQKGTSLRRRLDLKKNSSAIGRVLHLLGMPRAAGRKTTSNLELPQYLHALLEYHGKRTLTESEENFVRELLEDFVAVLMAHRLYIDRREPYRWRLTCPTSETHENAEKLGRQVIGLLKAVMPLLPIEERLRIQMREERGIKAYRPVIVFGKEAIRLMRADYSNTLRLNPLAHERLQTMR